MSTVIPSPNIWNHAHIYEIENQSFDPDHLVEAAMREIHPWAGLDLADIGCGAGYHLPLWAREARNVVGIEPHPPLLGQSQLRVAGLRNVRVIKGTAQQLPLPENSVDVVHARWAYFFGPGCEPGLAEVARVVRRGGTAFVIDNDASASTFGRWFRRFLPHYDPDTVEEFWSRQGFSRRSIMTRWEMQHRSDFEAVVRIEFSPELAARILDEHQGISVDYAVNLFYKHF